MAAHQMPATAQSEDFLLAPLDLELSFELPFDALPEPDDLVSELLLSELFDSLGGLSASARFL